MKVKQKFRCLDHSFVMDPVKPWIYADRRCQRAGGILPDTEVEKINFTDYTGFIKGKHYWVRRTGKEGRTACSAWNSASNRRFSVNCFATLPVLCQKTEENIFLKKEEFCIKIIPEMNSRRAKWACNATGGVLVDSSEFHPGAHLPDLGENTRQAYWVSPKGFTEAYSIGNQAPSWSEDRGQINGNHWSKSLPGLCEYVQEDMCDEDERKRK